VKTSYDPATDSLYIHLANRASIDSDEVTEGIVLDYDLNGVMVGIDVQRASQRIDLSGETVKRSGHEGNANEQEERALSERRVAQAKSFDALPCLESKLDDLAMGQFDAYRREAVDAETIAANHRPLELQLASLRLYDPDQHCATHAGVLLVGKKPRFFLPGAYVQYLEFAGTSLADVPIDQAEVAGDLPSVLKELLARLRLVIKTAMVSVNPLQEKLVPNYPEGALRELLMNAVMHRNYASHSPIRFYVFADHIEIQNPGGLYGEATQANFPTRNSYRNPVIAEALKSQGYVNRFGYGVQRAQALLAENGNPPLEFDFDEHSVRVKVRKKDRTRTTIKTP